jgi:hypothetical protein
MRRSRPFPSRARAVVPRGWRQGKLGFAQPAELIVGHPPWLRHAQPESGCRPLRQAGLTILAAGEMRRPSGRRDHHRSDNARSGTKCAARHAGESLDGSPQCITEQARLSLPPHADNGDHGATSPVRSAGRLTRVARNHLRERMGYIAAGKGRNSSFFAGFLSRLSAKVAPLVRDEFGAELRQHFEERLRAEVGERVEMIRAREQQASKGCARSLPREQEPS